jgi:hypothetical protein
MIDTLFHIIISLLSVAFWLYDWRAIVLIVLWSICIAWIIYMAQGQKAEEQSWKKFVSNVLAFLKKPRSIPYEIFIVLLSGFLLDVRFEVVVINRIIAVFLSAFPLYVFFQVLKRKSSNIYTKIAWLSVSGLFALASLVFLTLNIFYLAAVIQDGGVDSSFEIVNSTSQGSARLVTYRTNGGATTGFGTVQRLEQPLLPGIYIIRHIYQGDDSSSSQTLNENE